MMKTVTAFLLGMLVMAATVLPTGLGPSAEEGQGPGIFYYDMGTIHVQFESEACGTQTLAVNYQIEFTDESKGTFITAYKPKIESYLFNDLSEHLLTKRNTRPKAVQKVMARSVAEVLGQTMTTDVLIMEVQVLDL